MTRAAHGAESRSESASDASAPCVAVRLEHAVCMEERYAAAAVGC